jgi:glycosyltransferase involved in cell wall biosynthesis
VATNLTDPSIKKLSVICTIYKGNSIVDDLVKHIAKTVEQLPYNFEIILVDDLSPDDSWKKIKENGMKHPFVKGIQLSRNFGQQIAMSAGIQVASGDYIVIMDGDLQNPPASIPLLLDELANGHDIVYTVSKKRNNFRQELSSKVFWYVLTKIFKVNIIKNQLMMKAMTREFAQKYNSYNEINRTVAGIINDIGMNYTVVEIENQKRHSGKSSYNFYKRFNLMIDMMLNMTNAPLNIIINLSLFTLFFTVIIAIYHLIMFFFYAVPAGFTSIILSVFFFGSLTLLILGIIGRYLSNIYTEVKNRPLFFIQKKVNF